MYATSDLWPLQGGGNKGQGDTRNVHTHTQKLPQHDERQGSTTGATIGKHNHDKLEQNNTEVAKATSDERIPNLVYLV